MKTKRKKVTKRAKPSKPSAADQFHGVVWGVDKNPLHCEAYCQDPETPAYLTHWKTREGDVLAIREMQFDHLLNARALLRRKVAKFSEIEEALSREVERRLKGEYRQYAGVDPRLITLLEAAKVADPMGKYDFDEWDSYGKS